MVTPGLLDAKDLPREVRLSSLSTRSTVCVLDAALMTGLEDLVARGLLDAKDLPKEVVLQPGPELHSAFEPLRKPWKWRPWTRAVCWTLRSRQRGACATCEWGCSGGIPCHTARPMRAFMVIVLRSWPCVQVPVADADFNAVRKVKAPLLTKACRRLLTDDRFAGGSGHQSYTNRIETDDAPSEPRNTVCHSGG